MIRPPFSRPPRSAVRVFSPALLLLLLAFTAGAAEVPSLDGQSDILAAIGRGLDIRMEKSADLRRETLDALQSLDAGVAKAGERYSRLHLLRNVSGEAPWSIRSVYIQFQDLEEYLRRKIAVLKLCGDRLARVRDEYSIFLDTTEEYTAAALNEAERRRLQGLLDRLREMRAEETELVARVHAELGRAAVLLTRLSEAKVRERERLTTVLAADYFERGDMTATLSGLSAALADLRTWSNDFPQFFKALTLWVFWGEALRYTLGLFVLFYWGWPFLRRRATGPPVRIGGWSAARFCTSLGLASLLALRLCLFTLNQFTNLAGAGLLTLGLTLALAKIPADRLRNGATPLNRLLGPLWGVFAAGALAQALALPPSILGLYTAATCALCARALHVRRPEGSRGAGGVVWRPTTLFMVVLAVCSPLGFGAQATILSQATFMVALTICGARALHRRAVFSAEEGRRGPSPLTLAFRPLVAVLMGAFFVLWVLHFVGGPGFSHDMLSREWNVFGASVRFDALAAVFILFFVLRLVLAWINLVLGHVRLRGGELNPAFVHTVNAGVAYVVWTLYVVASLSILGAPMTSLSWMAGGLSVGVGFGLKDIVNNFISGLIILFGGTIKKGDVIQQGKNVGEVIDVSVRNTTIRTSDNTMVIIPNSTFLQGEIVNLSYQDAKTRLTIPLTTAPKVDVDMVKAELVAAAQSEPGVMENPAPEAALVRFGKMGLDFELYVWIEHFQRKSDVETALVTEIQRRLHEAGVPLAFQGVSFKYETIPAPDSAAPESGEAQASASPARSRRRVGWIRSRRAASGRQKSGRRP